MRYVGQSQSSRAHGMVHARLTWGIMYRYVDVEVLDRATVNARSLNISNLSDLFGEARDCWCVGSKTTGTRKTEEGVNFLERGGIKEVAVLMRHLSCLAVCVYRDIRPGLNLHRVGFLS